MPPELALPAAIVARTRAHCASSYSPGSSDASSESSAFRARDTFKMRQRDLSLVPATTYTRAEVAYTRTVENTGRSAAGPVPSGYMALVEGAPPRAPSSASMASGVEGERRGVFCCKQRNKEFATSLLGPGGLDYKSRRPPFNNATRAA